MVTRKTGGKRKRDLRRKQPAKERRPYILIVCEGSKTEPNYYHSFRKQMRMSEKLFQVVGKETGTHPKTIVKEAKKKQRDLRGDGFEYKTIWCVFDCDEHEKIHEAFDQANTNKFKVIFSNPCFELWFFLHYDDKTAHIERNDICSALKKHLPDYEKAAENMYDQLKELQDKAIERAVNLRKWHENNEDEPTKNPATNVDELVEYLNNLHNNK